MTMRNAIRFLTQLLGAAVLVSAVNAQEKPAGPAIRTDAATIEAADVDLKVTKIRIRNLQYNNNDHPDLQGIKGARNIDYLVIELSYEWTVNAKALKRKDGPQKQGGTNYWIDELVFDWRVALAGTDDGTGVKQLNPAAGGFNVKDTGSIRMKKSVTCANVHDKGTHTAIALIDARTAERYLERYSSSNVFCDLRIRINGREVTHMNSWGDKFYASPSSDAEKGGGDKDARERAPFIPRRSATGASLFESERVKQVDSALLSRQETPWQWANENALDAEVPTTTGKD